ncbi:hypothetical protein PG984_006781 [Apiospora sp. TS-2023a]
MEDYENSKESRLANTALGEQTGVGDGATTASSLLLDMEPPYDLGKDTSFVWQDDDMWATIAYAAPEGGSIMPPPMTMETEPVSADAATDPPPTTCKNAPRGSSCFTVVTGLLKSISRDHSRCCLMRSSHDRLSSATPPSSVDSVLSTTQAVLRTMGGLRHCSCHADLQLQLVLTVILAEVVTTYRRIIGAYTPSDPGGAAVSNNSGGGGMGENGQQTNSPLRLRRAPLRLGDHDILEDNIERLLIGQVLASRFKELEGVMGEILQSPGNPEGARGGEHMRQPLSSLLLGEVYRKRDSFLQAQLSAAWCELVGLQLDETNNGGSDAPPGVGVAAI